MFALLRSKSFLKRYLISYFILLIIPFSTILFTQLIAGKVIKENIIESSQNTLTQFFNLMDNTLYSMKNEAMQILNNDLVKQHEIALQSQKPVNYYQLYEIKKYLQEYNAGDSTFTSSTERFVYFHQSDMIVSASNSALNSNLYYQAYYANEKQYDDFYEKIAPKTGYMASLVSLDNKRPCGDLAVTVSGNVSNVFSPSDITCVTVIGQAAVRKIMNGFGGQQGLLIIFDGSGNALAYSGPGGESITLASYNGTDSLYYDTFDGKEYAIQVYASRVCEATYAYALPTAVFWAKLYGLNLAGLISILLCAVACAVLSVVLARKSYHPIGSLVSAVSQKTSCPYDSKTENEMDFVIDILNGSISQNAALQNRLQSQHKTLREEFLLRALQGTLFQNKKDPFADQYGIHENDLFCVALIRIEQVDDAVTGPLYSGEGQYNTAFIITNVMEELCREKYNGNVVGLTQTVLAALVNFPDSERNGGCLPEVLTICQRLQSFIREQFSILCTVSVSEPAEGLTLVHNAYLQANDALEYRYLYGRQSIIPYHEIIKTRFQYNYAGENRSVQLLLQYIKEPSDAEAREAYDSVQECLFSFENASLETVDSFRYNLIHIINKALLGLNLSWLSKECNFNYLLLRAETYEEFKGQACGIFEKIRGTYRETRQQYTLCDKTEDYIRKNYADQTLNNNIIGQHMNISPSYLSRLFREEKGISLVDFLTGVRVEKAKDLLEKTERTISEIAVLTGFSCSTIFIKTFKRSEGITPGEYRNLHSR